MVLVPSLRRSAALAAILVGLKPSSLDAAESAGPQQPTKNLGKGFAKLKARADFLRAMSGVDDVAGDMANANANAKARRKASAATTAKAARANLRRKLAARARPMPASMRLELISSAFASVVPPPFPSEGADSTRGVPLPRSSAPHRRRLDDAEDDGYGFDVTQYSFKYAGCSAVATYSDDMADDEDSESVVLTKRFVVFRLCPTAYCSEDYPYGCGGGYGEYIVDMEDYLDVMAQYQEERMERYCDYCEQCMNADGEEEDEGDEQRGRRRLDDAADEEEDQQDQDDGEEDADEADDGEDEAAGDDAVEEDEDEDAADDGGDDGDDAVEDAAADANENANQYCDDYQSCYNYANVCGDEDGNDNGEEEVDYRDFFECKQVDGNENNNGQEYFVGPHCSYDKKTITIGLYADEYCSEYVGNDVDMGNVLGFYVDSDALAEYYDEDCVSCNAADLPYQEQDEDEDEDGNNDGDEEAEVTELCEMLFEEAGKCHRYMEDVDEDAYGENQAANEDTVCGFIQNVVTGQYDEYGYIYLSADDYSNDNRDNQYATVHSEVSIGQIFGLLVSALACVVLVVWACFLHRKLTRRAPWRPRRAGGSGAKAGKLSRNNSGILMGRSRSGGSYHGGQMT